MKRRTALKASLFALLATPIFAYDTTKVVNKRKMNKKDPKHPTKGELKHTPAISIGEVDKKGYLLIEVTVGEEGIIHPSTKDHWIYKIELYANGTKVSEVALEPTISSGYLVTKVKKEGLHTLKAVASCNLHGTWENSEVVK